MVGAEAGGAWADWGGRDALQGRVVRGTHQGAVGDVGREVGAAWARVQVLGVGLVRWEGESSRNHTTYPFTMKGMLTTGSVSSPRERHRACNSQSANARSTGNYSWGGRQDRRGDAAAVGRADMRPVTTRAHGVESGSPAGGGSWTRSAPPHQGQDQVPGVPLAMVPQRL